MEVLRERDRCGGQGFIATAACGTFRARREVLLYSRHGMSREHLHLHNTRLIAVEKRKTKRNCRDREVGMEAGPVMSIHRRSMYTLRGSAGGWVGGGRRGGVGGRGRGWGGGGGSEALAYPSRSPTKGARIGGLRCVEGAL